MKARLVGARGLKFTGWVAVTWLLACNAELTEDASGTAGATSRSSAGQGGSGQGGAGEGGAGPGGAGEGASAGATGNGGSTGVAGGGGGGNPPTGCTADGLALIAEVNAYRTSNGLNPVPASSSMCIVSEFHISDLANESPDAAPECNLHSWSSQPMWTGCCYTADHAQAQCMWGKPGELSTYPGTGYEIAASGTSSPENAVMLWSNSPAHNAVMLNQDTWTNFPWGAMGAAIGQGYAVVWFGEETDPMP